MEVEEKKRDNNRFLVMVLVFLLILIMATIVAIIGFIKGWFSISKHEIVLANNSAAIEEGDTTSIKIRNYAELDSPDYKFSGYDESVVQVSQGRGGAVNITGVTEGITQITLSAKDCKDQIIYVTVSGVRPVTSLNVARKAYSTPSQQYYFLNDNKYVVISERYEYYSRGDYTVETLRSKDLLAIYSTHYNSVEKAMENLVDEGTYYRITLDGHEEYLGGTRYSDVESSLIVCVNRRTMAIYDVSWDELTEVEVIDMIQSGDIDGYFDF